MLWFVEICNLGDFSGFCNVFLASLNLNVVFDDFGILLKNKIVYNMTVSLEIYSQ